MFKLFAAFAFIFVVGSLLSALFSGNSFGASTLSGNMTDSSSVATIGITSATGYLNPGGAANCNVAGTPCEVAIIEGEIFLYSNIELTVDATCAPFSAPCLTGVSRGENFTDPKTHASGEIVYSELPGTLNMIATMAVARNTVNVGPIDTLIPSPNAFVSAVGSLVVTDYAFFSNVQLIRIFVLAAFVGFIGALLIILFSTVRGLFG